VPLFVRYVSDKYAGKNDALVDVPNGGSFSDLVKLKAKPNIGEGIMTVLSTLAEANGLRGVIDIALNFIGILRQSTATGIKRRGRFGGTSSRINNYRTS
jgi:hypothetical protein